MDTDLAVIESVYRLYKKFTDINIGLPKAYRYGLGNRVLDYVQETLELLLSAKSAPKSMKAQYLMRANVKLGMIKIFLRIYLSEKLINETSVFQLQGIINETGRQLGGWLKSVK
jgi:hypothetical protein